MKNLIIPIARVTFDDTASIWPFHLSLLPIPIAIIIIIIIIFFFFPRYTPFGVWDWPWGQWIACQLSKRGDWVGYTQSTLLPQKLLGRTVAWAIEPAFHWRGLVGQLATGHWHLPQFWISAKSITITWGAVSLCACSPPRGGLQPWASHHHHHHHRHHHHHHRHHHHHHHRLHHHHHHHFI